MHRSARLILALAVFLLSIQGFAEGSKNVGKVNINTASAAELDTLPYIGEKTAIKIIEYRERVGGFKSVEEIKNVKGIGNKKFERIKNLIAVN